MRGLLACMCSYTERLVSGPVRHRDITPGTNTAYVISTGAPESIGSVSEGTCHLQLSRWCSSSCWLRGVQLPALCLLGVVVLASSMHSLVSHLQRLYICDQYIIVCQSVSCLRGR